MNTIEGGLDGSFFQGWLESQFTQAGADLASAPRGYRQAIGGFLNDFEDSILFEDDDFLAINKPPGVISHWSETSLVGVQEVAQFYRGPEVFAAHRIDRDTSGILLLSKNWRAWGGLKEQFANRSGSGMTKRYLTLVEGEFITNGPQKVEVGLAKSQTERMKVVSPKDKDYDPRFVQNSLSFFESLAVLRSKDDQYHTFVEARIVTGRTHQIRVVMADHLHYPVVGDPLYGSKSNISARTMLHAHEVELRHPVNQRKIVIQAEVPDDFRQALNKLEWDY